jgi:hypothetical protein
MANILRKNKICFLFLAFAFCNYSLASDVPTPNVMKIKFYYTEEAVLSENPSGIIPVSVTSETTFCDLQNKLRQLLKRPKGSLMNGSFKIDAWHTKKNFTISDCFKERNYVDETFEDFAQYFSFWAFDFTYRSDNQSF